MPTEPKKIFVVDDGLATLAASMFEGIFPHSEILGFSNSSDAIENLKTVRDGNYPELLFLDSAFEGSDPLWGADNAITLLAWLKENAPNRALPNVVFQSQDINKANTSLRMTRSRMRQEGMQAEIIAIDKDDIRLVEEILKTDGTPSMSDFERANLPAFLNRFYDFELPVTQIELNELLKSRNEIDPNAAIRLVSARLMERDDALVKLAGKTAFSLNMAYQSNVVHARDERDLNSLHALSFQRATGRPVAGPAAFSAEDAIRQSANGKKPVLILQSVEPDIVQLFKHVAAIIIFANKESGHMKLLMDAHQIPALLGRQPRSRKSEGKTTISFHYARPGKESSLSMHSTIDPGKYGLQTLIRRGAEELKRIRPKTPGEGNENSGSKNLYKVKLSVRPGDEVTVDPGSKLLYATGLKVEEPKSSEYYSWLESVNIWLNEWQADNDVKRLKFKNNIDVTDQMYGLAGEGIGLVRTEHLVLSSKETLKAFRTMVLRDDDGAQSNLQQSQKDDFENILEPLCNSEPLPVRIRLMDAPPAEFFNESDLPRFEALYGNKNLRGVQFAARLPQLYEIQIRAIFEAYLTLQENAKMSSYRSAPFGPVEIMVPTTKTASELLFVKDMITRIAAETDFAPGNYRFGSMLETLDACKNIREIAPLCEFISIGSNDLTAEILNCDRDDWTKRHRLTVTSGTNSDPFIVMDKRVLSRIGETVKEARAANPALQVDLCGAHASDLASLIALRPLELDGVSMPPSPLNQQGLAIKYKYDTFHLYRAKREAACLLALRSVRKETVPT